MKARRLIRTRLWVEELEPRVVLSTSPALPEIVPTLLHSIAATSTNWSGYAAEAGTNMNSPQAHVVSDVRGSWIVPAVTGKGTAFSSIWVGIDGYNSSTVEQIGTDSDIVNGQAQYYAWYEMYPKNSFNVTKLTIHAGDRITASVTYASPNQYALTLTDDTTTKSFSITKTASRAQRSSAEWIVEAPSSVFGVLPLANFGTATITGASATINGTPGPIDNPTWQNASIDMVSSGGATEATPSPLTSDTATTSSFSVTNVALKKANPPLGRPPLGHTNSTMALQADGTPTTVFQTVPQPDVNRILSPAITGAGFGAASAANLFNVPPFQQRDQAAVSGTGAGIATANFRLSSLGETIPDLNDAGVPPQRLQEAPAPAVQPAPNRDNPPAAPAPMQQQMSSPQGSTPAILGEETAAPDLAAESRGVRSGGLLPTFVSGLGAVGAFGLFGNGFSNPSRDSDERVQFERDPLPRK